MQKETECTKIVASNSSFKARKILADGYIMSVLVYGIQGWGPYTPKIVLSTVKRVQNLTACWVLKKPWWIKAKDLLKEVG